MAAKFDGKVYEVDHASLLAQETHARSMMRELHEKYMELGFEWDGMDGYTAPAGMGREDIERVFREIADRRMDNVRKSLS